MKHWFTLSVPKISLRNIAHFSMETFGWSLKECLSKNQGNTNCARAAFPKLWLMKHLCQNDLKGLLKSGGIGLMLALLSWILKFFKKKPKSLLLKVASSSTACLGFCWNAESQTYSRLNESESVFSMRLLGWYAYLMHKALD